MQEAIVDFLNDVTPFQVANVVCNFEDRLAYCVAAKGAFVNDVDVGKHFPFVYLCCSFFICTH